MIITSPVKRPHTVGKICVKMPSKSSKIEGVMASQVRVPPLTGLIIPTLFRKSVGDIVIASVRPSVHYVISSQTARQNPTKFGEWLAYTSGACKSMFIFGPTPRGPGEGSKGQILTISNFKVNFKDFYAKMCTYTQ